MKQQVPNRPCRRSFTLQKNSTYATAFLLVLFGFLGGTAYSQTGSFSPVTNKAPHNNGGVMLLLSDGRVMCKAASGGDQYGNLWDILTPDSHGNYASGTWTTSAPMISTRLYFSSDILKDGRVFVAGGEYGTGAAKAEVYDPIANTWTAAPAPGVSMLDANSEMLENGQVLESFEASQVITKYYSPVTNTWASGPNVHGSYDEACWVKLPDQSILYVNINSTSSERYIPATKTWIVDANAPVNLYDPYGEETGPGFLLPNGQVFFFGSPANSAYYTPSGSTTNGTWTTGPAIPNNGGCPDAAGALMPNGKILIAVSPKPTSANHFPTPTTFYEFDYTSNTFTAVTAPGGGTTQPIATYVTNMLDLPNGQVLYSQQQQSNSNQYYVYTPFGPQVDTNKAVIANVNASSGCGSNTTYIITGTGFNGNSEGAVYGDDWQMATDWPIVKLTSGTNVYYCRSFNWNHTTPMSGTRADTAYFVVPASVPQGTYTLTVVTNGITSDGVSFTPTSGSLNPTITGTSPICKGQKSTLTANSGVGITYQWMKGSNNINGATNQTYTTGTAATYSVFETSGGCSGTSAPFTLVVNPLPTATITPLGNLDICQTGSVVLEANAGTGLTYQWQKGSNILAGQTNQDYTATSTGTYKVTVTNSNNCSKLSAGTKVTSSCREASLTDQSDWSLSLYPNPAVNQTSIQFNVPQASQVIIRVYDVNGKELKTLLNNNLDQGDHVLQFNTGDLSSGVYFVRMFTDAGVENMKLIIQK